MKFQTRSHFLHYFRDKIQIPALPESFFKFRPSFRRMKSNVGVIDVQPLSTKWGPLVQNGNRVATFEHVDRCATDCHSVAIKIRQP